MFKGTLQDCTHSAQGPVNSILCTVPEIKDPVFAKTSQNARFLLSENERFGLVFVKTGSINSGTGEISSTGASIGYITLYWTGVSDFVVTLA
jgi:hypothetical protein